MYAYRQLVKYTTIELGAVVWGFGDVKGFEERTLISSLALFNGYEAVLNKSYYIICRVISSLR